MDMKEFEGDNSRFVLSLNEDEGVVSFDVYDRENKKIAGLNFDEPMKLNCFIHEADAVMKEFYAKGGALLKEKKKTSNAVENMPSSNLSEDNIKRLEELERQISLMSEMMVMAGGNNKKNTPEIYPKMPKQRFYSGWSRHIIPIAVLIVIFILGYFLLNKEVLLNAL